MLGKSRQVTLPPSPSPLFSDTLLGEKAAVCDVKTGSGRNSLVNIPQVHRNQRHKRIFFFLKGTAKEKGSACQDNGGRWKRKHFKKIWCRLFALLSWVSITEAANVYETVRPLSTGKLVIYENEKKIKNQTKLT